ncbi:hypothetical protein [Micromonospora siamensis]|uniref:Uncharacterized protein n=1 Tax=Micromonospora siamensis TaxID=299152 RepID=A0A1C5JZ13_9ACTN|nr:hypothetical protein [Micromonospora siamensis]SCG75581.1 hypothetical protein GA0074704_5195 [Micromonospora siamensis]
MRHDEQGNTDRPEAVRSAPVAVPPPGTTDADEPYRDRDGRTDVPEEALDDRGTFGDPVLAREPIGDRREAGELDDTRRHDVRNADRDHDGRPDGDLDGDGRPEFHEPAPLPTAFGAATVGDAVAASALASGRPADERDARGEDTALPGDGAPGRTDAFDDERADPTAGDRLHSRERRAGEHAEGGHPTRDDDVAGYGSATPTMVDPDAEDRDADAGRDPRTSPEAAVATAGAGTTGVAGAGLAGAARPAAGNVPADAATLFEPETAQGFRDRWRDVQLRFVDDPKAAVGEAQSLVEEAIQALSSALAAQKDKLGGWQDNGSVDTEQLRVAVRQYRDFLDRVLGR